MKRALVPVMLLLSACDTSDPGEGTVRFTLWGEDFIEQGIPAEEFVDGWSVTFDVFEVSVTAVDADGEALPGTHVVDIAEASGGEGHALGTAVLPADRVPMASWTISSMHAQGTATREGVEKHFDWSFDMPVRYVECDTGTPLASGDVTDVVLTVHADHLFYDDLDSEEPGVAFDLIAVADADDDGEVTMAELEAQSLAGEVRYQVGSRDIDDLHAFIVEQARTVGHINGEGHCEIE